MRLPVSRFENRGLRILIHVYSLFADLKSHILKILYNNRQILKIGLFFAKSMIYFKHTINFLQKRLFLFFK